ncbi:DUF2254 domain-containing protein [Actinokineospora fastidiosa]|uniref:DUF2254 domain-containing protein n=1 Tax=Actinokineospora fastidiosa TaxID=1816 RepID=UPI0016713ED2|nr:DUF2254 domain-containing protein [Actinokineospora fastidiosa]
MARNSAKQSSAERSGTPLWLWPGVGGVVGFVCALVSVPVRLDRQHPLGWPGGLDSATAFLQSLATSVITVTGLTFTLIIVALQLASQQFSPRLLREFMRDRVIKAVLAVLVSTFVFAVTALRYVGHEESVPDLTLLIASAGSLAVLTAILVFITHIARVLRVDTMMRAVHDETDRAIRKFYPEYGDPRPRSPAELDVDGVGEPVHAESSGFVRFVDIGQLLRTAAASDALIELEVRPGDHVVRGTPLASAWSRRAEPLDLPAVEAGVRKGVVLDYERTVEQDAAFGFRQLTDIAVKALSPGVNDPVTAIHAVGHMSDLLVKTTGRRLGGTLHEDDRGVGRVVVPDRDLTYYLDLACGQIRRYGRREPTVLNALLRMLRDVAAAARDDDQRAAVAVQVDLITDEVDPSLSRYDVDGVEDMARRVRLALTGDLRAAYRDRSGETRSS